MKKDKIMKAFEIVQKRVKEVSKKYDSKYLYGVLAGLVILGAGWYFLGPKNSNMMMPKVNAKVAVVSEEVIKNSKKYVALVEAINSVDVVAKVSGSLDKVNFVEGSFVKKDDPLFVIDKEPYQANYDLAKAQMESAEATLTRAERDYNRQKQLSAKNISSKATFDAAESAYLQAKAAVSQAKARLNLAEIDLKNTEVKAYIDGQIGKTQVTVGNFVTASSMVLARVSQIDPIRIAFSVTDKEFLEIQRAKEQEDINDLTINIELSDGDVLHEKLEQAFASNETNMGTATIAIYVDVKNDKHYLNPGTYVNISFTSNREKKGLVVPETAIIQSDNVSLVFVVGEDNVAKMRPVTLGEAFDGKQVIASGLNAGERVLISGLANRMLRDGAIINVIDDTSNTAAQ
jgi:membrane fusion protein (multidrug efflux system)